MTIHAFTVKIDQLHLHFVVMHTCLITISVSFYILISHFFVCSSFTCYHSYISSHFTTSFFFSCFHLLYASHSFSSLSHLLTSLTFTLLSPFQGSILPLPPFTVIFLPAVHLFLPPFFFTFLHSPPPYHLFYPLPTSLPLPLLSTPLLRVPSFLTLPPYAFINKTPSQPPPL